MIRLEGNFEVKEIKRKTSAKFFKDLQIGDVLTLATDATRGGRGYAGAVHITDMSRGVGVTKSQAELDNILRDTFVLAPVQQPSAADILSDLYDEIQDMRESGEHDLRTVLHQIERLQRGTN